MKRYSLVLAGNGSPWFFQGQRNAHWPDRLIADLKKIPAPPSWLSTRPG